MKLDVRGFLEKSIKDYCQINNIDDIDSFSKRCLQQGFNIVKFGTSPLDNIQREKNGIFDVEKEKRTHAKNKKSLAEEARELDNSKGESCGKQEEETPTIEKEEAKKPLIVRKIKVIKKA